MPTGTKFFRQIKPGPLSVGAIRLEMLNALRKVGTEIKEEFDKTTATWNTQVTFTKKPSLAGNTPSITVETDSDVYRWVNDGTEPHRIRPGSARSLTIPSGYAAKTRPGVIGSESGGPSGSIQHAMFAEHPGIKPRKFDEAIYNKLKDKIDLGDLAAQIARASGHQF